jgi:hypothetical protein
VFPAEPVCSCAFLCRHEFAHETSGAARTRSSLRPRFSRAPNDWQASGAWRRGVIGASVGDRHCERSEAIQLSFLLRHGLLRYARNDAEGGGPATNRSVCLTNFWHCGGPYFSFRTGTERRPGNEPSTVLAEGCASKGSGNADSQPNGRSSGGSGACRPSPGDSGCVTAHPASWRASASYRPLRAVWAVAPGHSGVRARSPDPFRARQRRTS